MRQDTPLCNSVTLWYDSSKGKMISSPNLKVIQRGLYMQKFKLVSMVKAAG